MRAVGYVRVSGRDQDISPDAQKEKIEGYCSLNNIQLLRIENDTAMTGTKSRRPGLKRAMQRTQAEKGVLIVYSLSRFSRSTMDCLRLSKELEEGGCHLVSLTEKIDTTSAMGRFFFTLMAALYQLEAEQTGERMHFIHEAKRRKGEKIGNFVEYGYDAVDHGKDHPKTLVSSEKEQRVIRFMRKAREEGRSFREIGSTLEACRIPTKLGGKRWHAKVINGILRRAHPSAT